MPVAGGSKRICNSTGYRCASIACHLVLALGFFANVSQAQGRRAGAYGATQQPDYQPGTSSAAFRRDAVDRIPLQRLTQQAQRRILSIAKSPTIYRRLPTQAIDCDQDMFLFLARHPDVMVGMWDLMGITSVKTRRTGPYQMQASDGSGTTCDIDLVYGDQQTHIYVADGQYDGKLVARPIRGKGVFIITSRYAQAANGRTTVTGTIDCFLQLDSLGADLVARTLSGLIGRSADNNFVETARFVTQVSQASQRNPAAMLDVSRRMPQVDAPIKQQFDHHIRATAQRAQQRYAIRQSIPDRQR